MSSFRSIPFFILCAASLARAQTAPAPQPAHDKDVLSLDTVVVSAGPDGRTAFDLAQGTSILASDELHRRAQATLGETLSGTAGVNSTYYGPGASRPIIRGLGGDRIRVLNNSVGALDASNISPDHNAAVEPLFAERVEVLRGPSTLLYGSSAVGGVINVIDNSIPSAESDGLLHGAVEGRAFGAANERAGVASLGFGRPGIAFRVNALKLKTDDVDIPGVARSDAGAPANQPVGTLPNSAIETQSASLGSTLFWEAGRLGAAISRYETVYGVPTGDDPPVSIDMKQTRLDLSGEVTQPFGVFRSAKARMGFGQYRHSEKDGDEIATTFENKAWEGRLELPHLALGELTGTVGVQGAYSDFSAVGEEVVTPPSRTGSGAVFVLEELKRDPVTFQFGARYERQSIALGAVDPALPVLPNYAAYSQEKKSQGGLSASLGAVYYPAKDYSIGFSAAYTERLPTAQELFSNGPHGGTGAYEVGSTTLGSEKSLGFDLSLRKRTGFVTGTVSVFLHKFSDYIYEQELAPAAIPAANNPDGLTPYQFVAKDADFHGAEADIILHLVERDEYHLHLDLMSDYVRAEQTTDRTPLPRIPALRYGARLCFEDPRWNTGAEVRHTDRQDRFTTTETATPGYTLINAHADYLIAAGRMNYTLFVRGDNLTNVTARVHSSFLKDFAPLPGRGISVGVRATF